MNATSRYYEAVTNYMLCQIYADMMAVSSTETAFDKNRTTQERSEAAGCAIRYFGQRLSFKDAGEERLYRYTRAALKIVHGGYSDTEGLDEANKVFERIRPTIEKRFREPTGFVSKDAMSLPGPYAVVIDFM